MTAEDYYGEIPTAEVVVTFGIPIQDPTAAYLTRKVLKMAFFLSVLAVVYSIFVFIDSKGGGVLSIVSAIWSLAFGLLFPLCGYLGAKHKNRSALRCFWCCGWLLAAMAGLGLISSIGLLVGGGFSVVVEVIISGAMTVLYGMSAYWGQQLYNLPYFVIVQDCAAVPIASAVPVHAPEVFQ